MAQETSTIDVDALIALLEGSKDKSAEGKFTQGLADDASVSWQTSISDMLEDAVKSIAKVVGLPADVFLGWYRGLSPELFTYLNSTRSGLGLRDHREIDPATGELAPKTPTQTQTNVAAADIYNMYQAALNWLGAKDSVFGSSLQVWKTKKTSGGGTGSGPVGLRKEDFDIDALAAEGQALWRSFLLDDNPNPRTLATAYVDAQIANPDQAMDYQTFIVNQIKKTGRYQSIFKNKPGGMSEQAYLSPYMATALQYVRPKDAANIAVAGAQFGADPASYRARLSRDGAVQNSAPFIQGLEQTLREVSGVLRG